MPQCFPHSPKTVKLLINFRRKNSPIKNLHWTHRKCFRQTYRKFFAESPKKECARRPKRKKQFKEFVFKKTSSKKNPWTLENSFDNPTRLFSPKIRNVFLKVEKQLKTLKIFWNRKFPSKSVSRRKFSRKNDNVMQDDPLNECRKQFFKSGKTLSDRGVQSFSSKLEKIVKVSIFFKIQTFLEKTCCSSRMHLWQLL